jgi:hypothetical protein
MDLHTTRSVPSSIRFGSSSSPSRCRSSARMAVSAIWTTGWRIVVQTGSMSFTNWWAPRQAGNRRRG